jgi:hypothetical protein
MWLASATSYCEESPDGTWQSALGSVLFKTARGGLFITLDRDEAVIVWDQASGSMNPGTAHAGDQVLIAGTHIGNVHFVTAPGATAKLCFDVSN